MSISALSAKVDQILSRISGDTALAEKAGKLEAEVARLGSEVSTLTNQANELRSQLAASAAEVDKLKAEAVASESAKVEAETKLAAAEAKAKELEAKLGNPSAQAAEILAKVGVTPDKLPKAEFKPASKTATRQEFEAMPHSERNKFFREGGKVVND